MILRHPWRLVIAGLALGWLFDLLFYGKQPGVSLLIFSLALLAGLGVALRSEAASTSWLNRALGLSLRGGRQPDEAIPAAIRGNLWLPAALLFFAAMGFLRANGFLTFLNICAMLMLLSLLAVYLTRKSVAEIGVIRLVWAPIQAFGLSLWRGGGAISQVTHQDLVQRAAVPGGWLRRSCAGC